MRLSSKLGYTSALALSVVLSACSHDKAKSTQDTQSSEGMQQQQQPGQAAQSQGQMSQTGTQAQAQPQAQGEANQPKKYLGQAHVSEGDAEVSRQQKVLRTETVRGSIPVVKQTTVRADINKLDAKGFQTLGFPARASEEIVKYRDAHGPFLVVNDLSKVPGVDEQLLEKMHKRLGVAPVQQAGTLGADQPQTDSSSSQLGQ